MARAQSLLSRFGLYKQDQLTARGRAVAALPVHPRVGHMLIWAAEHGAARLACRLAVQLEEQSRGSVDLEAELKTKLPSHLQRRASQLEQLLDTKADSETSISAAVLLAQAYPDWIAQPMACSCRAWWIRLAVACIQST